MNIPENDFERTEEKPSKKSKSFYAALAICAVAVSAAGWSTYESVKDFINPPPKSEVHQHANTKALRGKGTSKVEDASKNSILEADSNQKARSNRELIPYDNEKKPVSTNEGTSSGNEDDVQAVSAEKSDPLIIYPVGNTITKEFSDGKPVYSETLGDWRTHNGTDFKAEAGSIIKAITSGTVKDIYSDPSYGTTIVIEHDPKFVAYYSGLGETALVEKGKRVKSGQEIGSINAVPCEVADESHLHLMINKDGQFIDPMTILDKEENEMG